MRTSFMELLGPAAVSWRKQMTRRRFGRDEILFREGDPGDTVHVIEKGRVLVRVGTTGGDKAALSVRGLGDVVGELALIGSGRRTATVVALEDTETLMLTQVSLDRLRAGDPRVDRFLVELLSEKLAEVTNQLMEVMFVPVDRRVLRVLSRLAAVFEPDGGPATVVIRQEDLAAMAGTRRQTVSRPLKEAQVAGAIRLGRGRIHVDDRALLAELGR